MTHNATTACLSESHRCHRNTHEEERKNRPEHREETTATRKRLCVRWHGSSVDFTHLLGTKESRARRMDRREREARDRDRSNNNVAGRKASYREKGEQVQVSQRRREERIKGCIDDGDEQDEWPCSRSCSRRQKFYSLSIVMSCGQHRTSD